MSLTGQLINQTLLFSHFDKLLTTVNNAQELVDKICQLTEPTVQPTVIFIFFPTCDEMTYFFSHHHTQTASVYGEFIEVLKGLNYDDLTKVYDAAKARTDCIASYVSLYGCFILIFFHSLFQHTGKC